MGEPKDACFKPVSPYTVWTQTTATTTVVPEQDFFILPNSGVACPVISFDTDQNEWSPPELDSNEKYTFRCDSAVYDPNPCILESDKYIKVADINVDTNRCTRFKLVLSDIIVTTTTTVDPNTPTTTTTTVSPIGGNYANYDNQANWNGTSEGNVTTVGSNGGPSAYGAYDMNGNVYEWNDLTGTAGLRGLRGGVWLNPNLKSWFSAWSPDVSVFFQGGGSTRRIGAGFRLASSLNPLNLTNFVIVGDAGNSNAGITEELAFGDVSYTYQIGKYTVTNCEYVEFLNAVASTDTYGLYKDVMNIDVAGGITRSGNVGSYTYSVKNQMDNKPVVFVNWFDCARYCNWLHNGKGSGDTETGAYTLNGAITGDAVAINAGANYRIPTENEWYKAAYYKGGGTNAGYWTYATQSDTAPTPVQANSLGYGQINGVPVPGADPIYNINCI